MTGQSAITNEVLLELLLAVGLAGSAGAEVFNRSFEDLDLDSLARMEIATRIQTRYGVDIEDELTAEETPEGLKNLVTGRLATTDA
jgi:acyl carrier protein